MRFILFAVLTGCLFAFSPVPALAQQEGDFELPSWATTPSQSSGQQEAMQPPTMPGSPEPFQVPVNGALALLALAGGALAVRRLRRDRI